MDLLHGGRQLASGTPQEIVDGIPGTVTDEAAPQDRATAWRHGRRWHQWHPDGDASAGGPYRPSLEDAAIVRELLANGSAA